MNHSQSTQSLPAPSSTAGSSDHIPSECVVLTRIKKQSGLTIQQLADATGISVGAVSIALSGIRYRNSEPRIAAPTDRSLARLASALRISATELRAEGRDNAALLLQEAEPAGDRCDRELVGFLAGREAVIRQMLTPLSTEELQAEITRRTSSTPQGPPADAVHASDPAHTSD